MLPSHCYVNVGADERRNRGDVTTPAKFWLHLHPCLLIFFHFANPFPLHAAKYSIKQLSLLSFVPFRPWSRDIWMVMGDGVGLNTGQAAGARGGGGCLRGGGLCDAPLTARALNGKVWGDALVTGVKVTLTVALGWLEVASRTAQTILPQILEEVPGETHVDPGVTAAVEAGQQHGDDEGRGCRRWDSRGMLLRILVQTLLISRRRVSLTITWHHVPHTILSTRASCLIRRRRGGCMLSCWDRHVDQSAAVFEAMTPNEPKYDLLLALIP